MNMEDKLGETIRKLPLELQKEIEDFIEFIVQKNAASNGSKAADEPDPLMQLSGLGAEIWKNSDSDEYIKEIRSDWD